MRDEFEAARAYVKRKDYDSARRVLRGIDHPKAKDWLLQLEQISPEIPVPNQWPESNTHQFTVGCLQVIAVISLAVGILSTILFVYELSQHRAAPGPLLTMCIGYLAALILSIVMKWIKQ
jgi:hypothetical protein